MGDILKSSNVSLGIGMDLTISNFGRFIGPVIAGILIDYFIDYSFVFSSFFSLISFIMTLLIFKITKKNIPNSIEKNKVSSPVRSLI